MRSTSALSPLTIECRRADIRAFWIITTAVLALALGLVSDLLGARAPWVWGVGSVGLLLPGLVWRPWFEMGVRAWNKAVRRCAVILRAYVLKVGYYLLFGAVGRTGSSLQLPLRDPETSRWIPRTRLQSAFGDCDRLTAAPDGWWGSEWLASVRNPGKAWQMCLLPVLMLLRVLGDEGQESALPSSTYTLY